MMKMGKKGNQKARKRKNKKPKTREEVNQREQGKYFYEEISVPVKWVGVGWRVVKNEKEKERESEVRVVMINLYTSLWERKEITTERKAKKRNNFYFSFFPICTCVQIYGNLLNFQMLHCNECKDANRFIDSILILLLNNICRRVIVKSNHATEIPYSFAVDWPLDREVDLSTIA